MPSNGSREESEALFETVNDDFNVVADSGGSIEDIFTDPEEYWFQIVKIFFRS